MAKIIAPTMEPCQMLEFKKGCVNTVTMGGEKKRPGSHPNPEKGRSPCCQRI